jgi:predicted nuclease with RNAse H fold
VRTVGVDLAAEPRATAVAAVDWEGGRGRVAAVRLGADDAAVLAALDAADRAAVDCPLGWPEPFVDFVVAHRHGHVPVPAGLDGLAWRRTLSRRTTDLACETATGVRPLSVAADRIAAVAMRGAGLLSALHARGEPVDRTGSGLLIETYPAAALKAWGLPHQGYKGLRNVQALDRLVDALADAAPALDLGDAAALCRRSDDAVDAVVCALVARAAALGRVTAPSPAQLRPAAAEGWIVLPDGPLSGLFP